MATTVKTARQKHGQYADLDEYIDYQIGKTRSSIKLTDILTTVAGVVTFVLGYVLFFVVFDHWIIPGGFSFGARLIMLTCLMIASCAWLFWKAIFPYLRTVNSLYAAQSIEQVAPDLKSSLLNLIDLRGAQRDISPPIMRSIEKRTAVALSHVDLEEAVDRTLLMRFSYALLAVVLVFCIYTVLTPKDVSPSVLRALLPTVDRSVATRTEIRKVEPGDAEILARTQLEVSVELSGEVPDEVTLYYTTRDASFVDLPLVMRPVQDGFKQFRTIISGDKGRGILQDFTYYIAAGDARTQEYNVTVIQPPSVTVTAVEYIYPEYMKLDPKELPGGNIDAWVGTKVVIHAEADMPLKTAYIEFFDGEDTTRKGERFRIELKNETQLRFERTLTFRNESIDDFARFYHIDCKNTRGHSNLEPTLYRVNVRPDLPPLVKLIEPRGHLVRPANAIVPLAYQALDDFLLRSIELNIEVNGDMIPVSPMRRDVRKKEVTSTYNLELEPLGLKNGDLVTFWLSARDNRQPVANRRESTPRINIEIADPVSQEEVQEQLQEDKQKQEEAIDEARKQNDEDPGDEGEQSANQEPNKDDSEQKNADANQGGKGSGKSGDKTESGDNKDAKDDSESTDESKNSDSTDEGNGTSEKRQTKKDGSEDGQVLKKLFERDRKELQEQLDKKQDSGGGAEDKPGKNESNPKTDSNTDPNTEKKDPDSKAGPNKNDEKPKTDTKDPGEEKNPDGADPKTDDQDPKNPKDAQPDENKSDNGNSKNETNEKDPNATGEKSEGDPKTGEDSKNSDPDGDSKSKSGDSKEKTGTSKNEQSGTGDNQKSPPGENPDSSDKKGKSGMGDKSQGSDNKSTDNKTEDGQGPSKPTKDDKNATDQKATGDEKGIGKPAEDPNKESTPAKNEIKREEGTKPSTKPSEEPNGNDPKPKATDDGSSKNPKQAPDNPRPPRKNQNEKANPDKRQSDPKQTDPETDKKQKPSKQDGQPDAGNDKLKGKPKEQKSKKPDGGDGGKAKDSDKGNSGSKKKGAGDTGKKPGSASKSGKKNGSGSAKKSGGSKPSQGPGKNPGKAGSKPSQSKKGDSGSGNPKTGKPGKPGTGSSSKSSGSKGEGKEEIGNGNTRSGDAPKPGQNVGQDGANNDEGDNEDDLEYSKKAANLVLKRLQEKLKRGEIDDKFLKELGWTKNDMQKFANRMQKQLELPKGGGDATNPQQRQLETTLKHLDLRSKGSSRIDSGENKRDIGGVGTGRQRVPAEYREAFDEYTRELLKRQKKLKN